MLIVVMLNSVPLPLTRAACNSLGVIVPDLLVSTLKLYENINYMWGRCPRTGKGQRLIHLKMDAQNMWKSIDGYTLWTAATGTNKVRNSNTKPGAWSLFLVLEFLIPNDVTFWPIFTPLHTFLVFTVSLLLWTVFLLFPLLNLMACVLFVSVYLSK